ncbi:tumor necrosis factor receptor superfamily member 26 isoform X1 [Myxocyprinus asiaticus]|uniref:tumor necrosis factor receptor superfamily member 26 isoform X1 n=1 Tax=Myxocyprinus asiaticus TaxID=70543 RepID=UPI0022217BA6|nr:tumor necrosis factor receptor superfamily member 26 isoform X1 [Myxocyprinus asiaticus]
MGVYKLVVCLCGFMSIVVASEGWLLRRKREICMNGEYQHEGKTCCRCPTGYRVLSDCTDKNITECERCDSRSFMSHPNQDHTCQPCKICNPNANMEMKEKCSPYSDTVCGCQEDHYCDKGDLCRSCYPCDTCEERGGVKTLCTPTKNTVCNDTQGSYITGKILAAILLLLFGLIAVCMVVFFLWKKNMFCFNGKQTIEKEDLEETLAYLKDVDLNPYLSDIASVLGWKLMKNIAQHTGMTKVDIEEHELNHPGNVKEQTYDLLEAWSQRQGLKGAYPTLIKTLCDIKNKKTADQVQKIIKKGQATAQPKTDQQV